MKGQGADLAGLAKRMDGALDVLRKELQGLRTGRASANLLEPITVEAYGSEVPLTQVATVNVPAGTTAAANYQITAVTCH